MSLHRGCINSDIWSFKGVFQAIYSKRCDGESSERVLLLRGYTGYNRKGLPVITEKVHRL